jgi:hypothetical protein
MGVLPLTRLALAVLVALSGACTSVPGHRSKEAAVVSICELFAGASTFDHQRVDVVAVLRPGAHYQVFIYDPQCDSRAAILLIPAQLEGDAEVKSLMERVMGGFPRKVNHVRARIEGELQLPSGTLPLVFVLRRVITVAPSAE